jgi:hypothetical protein
MLQESTFLACRVKKPAAKGSQRRINLKLMERPWRQLISYHDARAVIPAWSGSVITYVPKVRSLFFSQEMAIGSTSYSRIEYNYVRDKSDVMTWSECKSELSNAAPECPRSCVTAGAFCELW